LITRVAVVGILAVILARSQSVSPPSSEDLTSLEIAAQKAAAGWQILARDLDPRLARMLPCDPRAKTAIDEVSRASQARLATLDAYYDAAAHDAKARRASVQSMLAAEEARLAETNVALAQAEQSAAALSKQLGVLTDGIRDKPNLEPASSALSQAQAPARDGVTSVRNVAARRTPLIAALRELVSAAEARDAALTEARTAFEAERARWNGYYAARLARSETECAIISPAAAPAKSLPRSSGKAK
jgi:hypothetical protein